MYDEFIAQSGAAAVSKDEAKAQGARKGDWFQRAIKTLGDIFVPIIPAIVASGFLMGIMESLKFMVNNGFIELDSTSSLFVLSLIHILYGGKQPERQEVQRAQGAPARGTDAECIGSRIKRREMLSI